MLRTLILLLSALVTGLAVLYMWSASLFAIVFGAGFLGLLALVLEARSAKLDDATLASDLAAIEKAFPPALLKKDFQRSDVELYYEKTTDRDYWLLELFCGPGLHTRLHAPLPIHTFGGHTRQPTIVFGELCKVKAKRVLEVGFGRGYCSFFLAGLAPDVEFVGIDLTRKHVQIANDMAKAQGYKNTTFLHMDAGKMDPAQLGGQFDLIFGVEALCHLDSVEARKSFLTNAHKQLAPGGRIVFVDGYRSDDFRNCSIDQKQAMEYSECGFRIAAMPSRLNWVTESQKIGFREIAYHDLASQSLPFWTIGWRVAHALLRFPKVVNFVANSSVSRAQTAANLLSVATTAHALRGERRTAEYGALVIEKK